MFHFGTYISKFFKVWSISTAKLEAVKFMVSIGVATTFDRFYCIQSFKFLFFKFFRQILARCSKRKSEENTQYAVACEKITVWQFPVFSGEKFFVGFQCGRVLRSKPILVFSIYLSVWRPYFGIEVFEKLQFRISPTKDLQFCGGSFPFQRPCFSIGSLCLKCLETKFFKTF